MAEITDWAACRTTRPDGKDPLILPDNLLRICRGIKPICSVPLVSLPSIRAGCSPTNDLERDPIRLNWIAVTDGFSHASCSHGSLGCRQRVAGACANGTLYRHPRTPRRSDFRKRRRCFLVGGRRRVRAQPAQHCEPGCHLSDAAGGGALSGSCSARAPLFPARRDDARLEMRPPPWSPPPRPAQPYGRAWRMESAPTPADLPSNNPTVAPVIRPYVFPGAGPPGPPGPFGPGGMHR